MESVVPFPAHLKTILCPIDFEPNSIAALDVAEKMARRDCATVWLMHVKPAPPQLGPAAAAAPGWEIQSKLEKIARERLGDKVAYEIIARAGDPGHEIVKAAREIEADLIVMATHGYTGTLRTLIGSVCDSVMQESPCPLLVVRPQPRPAAAPEHPERPIAGQLRASKDNPLFFWEDA